MHKRRAVKLRLQYWWQTD